MDNRERDIIFDRIRRANPMAKGRESILKAADQLLAMSAEARPPLLANDPADAFRLRLEARLVIGTSCEIIDSLSDLPAAIQRFLSQKKLEKKLRIQKKPQFLTLAWQHLQIDADIEQEDALGLCWADYGIAETGSYVMHSSEDNPILLHFLPRYLLVALPKSKILPYMDDYALIANQRATCGSTPRNSCIISGASGTTDIEGVLVKGAHGPELVHIFIVEDV